MRKIFLTACMVILVIGAMVALLLTRPAKQVNVTVGGLGQLCTTSVIFRYGQEMGIFDKYDLNITYVSYRDPYTLMLAFLTGKVDIHSTSPGLAAASYGEGEKFRIPIVLTETTSQALLARSPNVEDLRGKRIGVMGKTSDSFHLNKWYLEKHGIDMEEDNEIVEIKSPPGLVTAFKTGQIDAVSIWGNFKEEVKASGGISIVTASQAFKELTGHPHYIIFLIREEFIVEKEKAAKNLLLALREVIGEVKTDIDKAAAIVANLTGYEKTLVKSAIDMELIGDLDADIKEDLIAFFEYGLQKDYFEEIPPEEIFWDEWR